MKLRELDDSFSLSFAGRTLKPEIPDAMADYWLTALPKYQTVDAATKATDRLTAVKPITGWRRLLIKRRLWNQYCAECRAAAV